MWRRRGGGHAIWKKRRRCIIGSMRGRSWSGGLRSGLVGQSKGVGRQRLGFGKSVIWLLPMLAIGPVVFVGMFAAYAILASIPFDVFDDWSWLLGFLALVVGGVVVGFMIGLVQSFALRHKVPWARTWVRATVAG